MDTVQYTAHASHARVVVVGLIRVFVRNFGPPMSKRRTGLAVSIAVLGPAVCTSQRPSRTLAVTSPKANQTEPTFQWALEAGGGCRHSGQTIAIDSDRNGSGFTTGSYSPGSLLGSEHLTGPIPAGGYVMHTTAGGTIEWLLTFGPRNATSRCSFATGTAIASDSTGGAFVTGTFPGTSSFGPSIVHASQGEADVFVMRVDSDGRALWAVSAGGPGTDIGCGILVDDLGALVMASFEGNATFGATMLSASPCNGLASFVVMRVDFVGEVQWAIPAGCSSEAASSMKCGIASDGHGGAFITSQFTGTVSLGATRLTSGFAGNSFVAHVRVRSEASIEWARLAIANPVGYVTSKTRALVSDGAGGALVVGSFSGKASIGATTIASMEGGTDAFVSHITSAGTTSWMVRAGGSWWDEAHGATSDGDGGALVTGFCQFFAGFGDKVIDCGDNQNPSIGLFVMRVSRAGSILWSISAPAVPSTTWRSNDISPSDQGFDLALDGPDTALLAGGFEQSVHFGSSTLTQPQDDDEVDEWFQSGFIARLLLPTMETPEASPPAHPLVAHYFGLVAGCVAITLAALLGLWWLLRLFRQHESMRASRDRATLDLRMLEHQLNNFHSRAAIPSRPSSEPADGGAPKYRSWNACSLHSHSPPPSFPPGPPSNTASGSGVVAPGCEAASDRANVLPEVDRTAVVAGITRTGRRWTPLQDGRARMAGSRTIGQTLAGMADRTWSAVLGQHHGQHEPCGSEMALSLAGPGVSAAEAPSRRSVAACYPLARFLRNSSLSSSSSSSSASSAGERVGGIRDVFLPSRFASPSDANNHPTRAPGTI